MCKTTLETFGRSNVFKVKVAGVFRTETFRGLKTIGTKFLDIGRTVFEKSHSRCIRNRFIRESIDGNRMQLRNSRQKRKISIT